MFDSIAPPARSLDQRRRALLIANRVRSIRAQAKRLVAADETRLVAINLIAWVDAPVGDLADYATMKIGDLLLATPRLGPVKTRSALAEAQVSPSKTLGGLTRRQRTALVQALVRRRTYSEARRAGLQHDEADRLAHAA